MRAPPESLRPITGAPTRIAWSMILQIFSACASESEPPNTVKSWLNTNTRRPFTVPEPVTTPSPGIRCSAMPKSLQRCSTNMSISSNEPGSRSSSRRSRADSLPRLCCAAIRRAPPPIRAPSPLGVELLEDLLHRRPLSQVVTPRRLSIASARATGKRRPERIEPPRSLAAPWPTCRCFTCRRCLNYAKDPKRWETCEWRRWTNGSRTSASGGMSSCSPKTTSTSTFCRI